MAATKYGKYIKTLKFEDPGKGCFRQRAVMDGKFLGLDAHIEYAACWTAGHGRAITTRGKASARRSSKTS